MDTPEKKPDPTPPPSPQVALRLDALAATAAPEPGPGTAIPPGTPETPAAEAVDWNGLLREGVEVLKANTAWVYPEKPVGMMVSGFAAILDRMPAEKAGAFIEKWAPYLMAGGGLLLLVRANTEAVEVDGKKKTRLRPLFKAEAKAAEAPADG